MPEFEITEPLGALPVKIAPGIAALSPLILKVKGWEGSYEIELTVTAVPAKGEKVGRFVCSRLIVTQSDDQKPVTTDGLRAIPVATLLRGVASRKWFVIDASDNEKVLSMTDRRVSDDMAERFRREGPTDEALEWVARAYRMALVLGDPPTKAVEDALGLKRSTAGRWVALARAQDFLSKAEGPGKAGG